MTMTNEITNDQDIIDSRDIIERIEELESELEALREAVAEAQEAFSNIDDREDGTVSEEQQAYDLNEALQAVNDAQRELTEWFDSSAKGELDILKALAEEAEAESSDWQYGEQLIRKSYFVDYITETIHDCYELPKEFNSGNWPFRHMTFDYEAAANEAEQDYASIDFDGVEYLIRSC
jgi:DNA repair exonuclease SbcCD ATPase subunit